MLLILKWLTQTKALEVTSGRFETEFFESVYRVFYITGLSLWDKGFLYQLYSYSVKSLIVLFVMSEIWYLCSEAGSLDRAIENINVTLIHLIAMYRYRNMLSHRETFDKLAGAMESEMFDVSDPRRKKLVQFWLNRSDRYFKLLISLGSSTLLAWYIYPLVDDLEYNLTVAVRLPMDYATPIGYPIAYIVTMIAFHYTSFFVIVNDLLMQVILMQILCQFSVLADCFENIHSDIAVLQGEEDLFEKQYDERWADIYHDRLRKLVEQHKFIMNNTMELRKILSTPMLGQLAASGMLICFAGYQVTATITVNITKFLMSVLYLGYNMFELFIFCRWCDEIRVQSENIREAVYYSGWERGASAVRGVRAQLMFIMARASKPVVLSAGGLYDLSLESYSNLVKTSYTALTVLLRLRKD